MQINIKSNIVSEIKNFKKLIENTKKEIPNMADSAIKKFAVKLKQKLIDLIKSQPAEKEEVKGQTSNLVRKYNYFKYEKDLIKTIFGEDLSQIVLNKDNLAYNTFGLNSNIHVMQAGYIRSFREIGPNSTLSKVLSDYRDSLNNGLILDKDTGEIFLLGEGLSQDHFENGIKLFCTTSRGVTPWSEATFEKYKRGERKVSGVDNRLAVPLTIKKRDLDRHLKKAIPLGTIQDLILEGKYDEASALLTKAGPTRYKNAAQKIQDMKAGDEKLPPEIKNLNKAIKTIKDVRVFKYKKTYQVDYKLNSTIESDNESLLSKDLFNILYPVLVMYIPDLEEKIVKDIVKSIEQIIIRYGSNK